MRHVAGCVVPEILRDCSAYETQQATDPMTASHPGKFDAAATPLWDQHTNYAECNNGEFIPFCSVISKTILIQKRHTVHTVRHFFQLLFKTSFTSKIFITLYLRDERQVSNNFNQFTNTKFHGATPNGPLFHADRGAHMMVFNNNNNVYLLQLGWRPVAVVIYMFTNIIRELI